MQVGRLYVQLYDLNSGAVGISQDSSATAFCPAEAFHCDVAPDRFVQEFGSLGSRGSRAKMIIRYRWVLKCATFQLTRPALVAVPDMQFQHDELLAAVDICVARSSVKF